MFKLVFFFKILSLIFENMGLMNLFLVIFDLDFRFSDLCNIFTINCQIIFIDLIYSLLLMGVIFKSLIFILLLFFFILFIHFALNFPIENFIDLQQILEIVF
jgi:hypothetical protein